MKSNEAEIHFLLHAATLVKDLVRQKLLSLGLGHSQARVLDALERLGPSSQSELAQELNITAASMSTMITRMLASGYLDRERDPHEKRSYVLRLSEAGEFLLCDVRAAWLSVDEIVQDKIGAERAAVLFEVARELRNSLGGQTPGEGRAKRDKSVRGAKSSKADA